MDSNEYQRAAARTLVTPNSPLLSGKDLMTVWCTLGAAGEVGEVVELVKKGILHKHGLDTEKLKKEIGDCLWYLAGLCTVVGLDMGDVMQGNIDKLLARYPEGFTYENSKHT